MVVRNGRHQCFLNTLCWELCLVSWRSGFVSGICSIFCALGGSQYVLRHWALRTPLVKKSTHFVQLSISQTELLLPSFFFTSACSLCGGSATCFSLLLFQWIMILKIQCLLSTVSLVYLNSIQFLFLLFIVNLNDLNTVVNSEPTWIWYSLVCK